MAIYCNQGFQFIPLIFPGSIVIYSNGYQFLSTNIISQFGQQFFLLSGDHNVAGDRHGRLQKHGGAYSKNLVTKKFWWVGLKFCMGPND